MNAAAEKIELGEVGRAPYQLAHLIRQLPEDFSLYAPFAEAHRPVATAVAHHASNANDTLLHGLAAIGHVLMVAGLNTDGQVDGSHLARLGDLITHLAVEMETMQVLTWAIREALQGEGIAKSVEMAGGVL